MEAVRDETGAPAPSLDASLILSAEDRAIEPFDVPEWGGRLWVRSLPYETVQGLYGKLEATKEGEAALSIDLIQHVPKILHDGVVTESGSRMFTLDQARAVARDKSFAAVMKVVNRVLSMSSLTAEAAEEIEGN